MLVVDVATMGSCHWIDSKFDGIMLWVLGTGSVHWAWWGARCVQVVVWPHEARRANRCAVEVCESSGRCFVPAADLQQI